MTTSMLRQKWLESAVVQLRKLITSKEGEVPENVRISIGWPKGGRNRIGECWYAASVSDGVCETFVSPELRDSVKILGVIAHELVHACLGPEAKHGPLFKQLATAIGLEGKMTATTESSEFVSWAEGVIAKIGNYPAGAIAVSGRKKQTTRMIKCACGCGYTVRLARRWLDDAGAPICPVDNIQMEEAA